MNETWRTTSNRARKGSSQRHCSESDVNFVDQRIGPRSFPPVLVVRGSKLVAKVGSNSFKKHRTRTIDFTLTAIVRHARVLLRWEFLAVVQYKRRHAKYTYNYKSYKYRHYEILVAVSLGLGWVRVHAQVAQIAASVVVRWTGWRWNRSFIKFI